LWEKSGFTSFVDINTVGYCLGCGGALQGLQDFKTSEDVTKMKLTSAMRQCELHNFQIMPEARRPKAKTNF
jgi:hypothetical protein